MRLDNNKYFVPVIKIQEFIQHWESIIYPYDEDIDQHIAVRSVLKDLENKCKIFEVLSTEGEGDYIPEMLVQGNPYKA